MSLQNYILSDIIQFILNEYVDHVRDIYVLSEIIKFKFSLDKYQSKLMKDGDGDFYQIIDGNVVFHMIRSQYINELANSPLKYKTKQ
jgi:hypothetical protein